jgi:hypothetical protein
MQFVSFFIPAKTELKIHYLRLLSDPNQLAIHHFALASVSIGHEIQDLDGKQGSRCQCVIILTI